MSAADIGSPLRAAAMGIGGQDDQDAGWMV
jgi:hypothetical protein